MTFSSRGHLSALVFSPLTTRATFTKCRSCTLPFGQLRLHFTTRANSDETGGRKTRLRSLARELCMERPAHRRSSPMEPAKRLNRLAQPHRDAFSEHGLWRCECTESEQKSTKPLICVQVISMAVAPGEGTTAGLGCSPGCGPTVRVAAPEVADPAHPQRGHAQGQA